MSVIQKKLSKMNIADALFQMVSLPGGNKRAWYFLQVGFNFLLHKV